MRWEQALLDDVRRHRGAYRALFGASVVLAVFAGTYVLAGSARSALVAAPDPAVLAGALPFALFPVAYGALVWRLLGSARVSPSAVRP